MQTTVVTPKKVKFKNPILVEGLPGIGNVGRVAAGYLVNELKMKKFAELYSPHFLPLVILHDDGVAQPLKCEFFWYRAKTRDIIVMTGDTQSISPEGHYDICNAILDAAMGWGVRDIITLGGFAEGTNVKTPRVIGAVNAKPLIKAYGGCGIDFSQNHEIGTIVGASGLLLGIGAMRNVKGLCLMGETVGMPLMTDPRAADAVLRVLAKILSVKIDLAKLENTIKDMEVRIKKTEKIHTKMLKEIGTKGKDDIRYIG